MNKFLKPIFGLLITGLATGALASDYYEFSTFAGMGLEYDVDSYGNTIYYGGGTSVYSVDVSIADMSKVNEPRFLSDGVTPNPNYQARTFSNNQAITLSGSPQTLNGASVGEMYIDANNIYTLGKASNGRGGAVYSFNKSTGAYNGTAVAGGNINSGWGYDSLLSYGGDKWWLANERSQVYSSTGGDWTYEFTWPSMNGGHGDGMEYVNGHIFVSDMTSNFIAMWDYDGTSWSETERFAYTEAGGTNKYVEGMGFGALGHFWAGSGSYIYELGGGSIDDYTNDVPEPGSLMLIGIGLMSLSGIRRFTA